MIAEDDVLYIFLITVVAYPIIDLVLPCLQLVTIKAKQVLTGHSRRLLLANDMHLYLVIVPPGPYLDERVHVFSEAAQEVAFDRMRLPLVSPKGIKEIGASEDTFLHTGIVDVSVQGLCSPARRA